MTKRFVSVIGTMLIGTMAFTGCSADITDTQTSPEASKSTEAEVSNTQEKNVGSDEKKIARLVSGGEPGSLHPALAQGTHESIILDHIYEGLMKRDKEGNIVPGMA